MLISSSRMKESAHNSVKVVPNMPMTLSTR